MSRAPILAAGGIVFRSGREPLIALVRLSKGDDWVLPKGKLNPGEEPKAAAKREVWEETGFAVSVHEFLGKLKYSAGRRQKVVHFWRMEASRKVSDPMDDVTDVDWLPLHAALKRLTRAHERDFLADIGPLAEKTRSRNGSEYLSPRPPMDLLTITGRNRSQKALRVTSPKRSISKQTKLRKASTKRPQPSAINLPSFFRRLRNWLRKNLFGGF